MSDTGAAVHEVRPGAGDPQNTEDVVSETRAAAHEVRPGAGDPQNTENMTEDFGE